MGIYHPRLFLVTTPSYTYNARFTSPNALPSVRKGFPDPTGRTDRVFRHHDHKFEWTTEEFNSWCEEVGREWGYEVHKGDIGRVQEKDEWGREEELGGATFVVMFRRRDNPQYEGAKDRESRAKSVVAQLAKEEATKVDSPPHELLAEHHHGVHSKSKHPVSPQEIGASVKATMEAYREAFMRLEELWFEKDIAAQCGGWIELLVGAIDAYPDLILKREAPDGRKGRENWIVEIIGGVANPRILWPTTEPVDASTEYMAPDWTPVEESYKYDDDDEEFDESTAAEGDVSWNESDASDAEVSTSFDLVDQGKWWQDGDSEDKDKEGQWAATSDEGWGGGKHGWGEEVVPVSATSSAGWDGDESESTTS
jgi:hypothetical protein